MLATLAAWRFFSDTALGIRPAAHVKEAHSQQAHESAREQAESIVEEAVAAVDGPVYHRKDIGTRTLIPQRCEHMRRLLRM
jgi:hypothetical protein